MGGIYNPCNYYGGDIHNNFKVGLWGHTSDYDLSEAIEFWATSGKTPHGYVALKNNDGSYIFSTFYGGGTTGCTNNAFDFTSEVLPNCDPNYYGDRSPCTAYIRFYAWYNNIPGVDIIRSATTTTFNGCRGDPCGGVYICGSDACPGKTYDDRSTIKYGTLTVSITIEESLYCGDNSNSILLSISVSNTSSVNGQVVFKLSSNNESIVNSDVVSIDAMNHTTTGRSFMLPILDKDNIGNTTLTITNNANSYTKVINVASLGNTTDFPIMDNYNYSYSDEWEKDDGDSFAIYDSYCINAGGTVETAIKGRYGICVEMHRCKLPIVCEEDDIPFRDIPGSFTYSEPWITGTSDSYAHAQDCLDRHNKFDATGWVKLQDGTCHSTYDWEEVLFQNAKINCIDYTRCAIHTAEIIFNDSNPNIKECWNWWVTPGTRGSEIYEQEPVWVDDNNISGEYPYEPTVFPPHYEYPGYDNYEDYPSYGDGYSDYLPLPGYPPLPPLPPFPPFPDLSWDPEYEPEDPVGPIEYSQWPDYEPDGEDFDSFEWCDCDIEDTVSNNCGCFNRPIRNSGFPCSGYFPKDYKRWVLSHNYRNTEDTL